MHNDSMYRHLAYDMRSATATHRKKSNWCFGYNVYLLLRKYMIMQHSHQRVTAVGSVSLEIMSF